MNKEFTFHLLSDHGKQKAADIAVAFDGLLEKLKDVCPEGREFALVRTKLEEACFFAKKSIAGLPQNHTEKNPGCGAV